MATEAEDGKVPNNLCMCKFRVGEEVRVITHSPFPPEIQKLKTYGAVTNRWQIHDGTVESVRNEVLDGKDVPVYVIRRKFSVSENKSLGLQLGTVNNNCQFGFFGESELALVEG